MTNKQIEAKAELIANELSKYFSEVTVTVNFSLESRKKYFRIFVSFPLTEDIDVEYCFNATTDIDMDDIISIKEYIENDN